MPGLRTQEGIGMPSAAPNPRQSLPSTEEECVCLCGGNGSLEQLTWGHSPCRTQQDNGCILISTPHPPHTYAYKHTHPWQAGTD